MSRVWLQGLIFSVVVHVLVLSGGLLWTLLRHTEAPDPKPIEARLVAPEPAAEAPDKPDGPEPTDAPTQSETEAQEPAPEPQAATKPAPEPQEPSEPETKTPKQPALKKRLAEREPEPEPEPKSEPESEPEPKPEPEPQETEPEQSDSTESEPAPAEDEPSESEPILGEDLSDRIAEVADQGGAESGSLRQRQAVARFEEAVRERVQSNWLLPPGLEDRGDLSATVRIALTAGGELAGPPEVVDSNGPGYFNSSVVRAVKKAAPFPMPDGPTQYFQELELHFSPDMVQ